MNTVVWKTGAVCAVLASLAFGDPAQAQPPVMAQTCVDVQIGSTQYYNCLNQQMQRAVPRQRPSAEADAPYNANSPAPAVGSFNEAGTHQRLGNNFGVSAFPQRPATQPFTPPVMPSK